MIEFYRLPGCPYCQRVERVLDELELEYDPIDVPGPRTARDEVERISGQRGVPVINDPDNDVHGMPESADIVEYLRATYGE